MSHTTTPDANISASYVAPEAVGSRAPGAPPAPAAGGPLSAPGTTVFAVGEYLVGDTEDTLLNGHPDIRY